MLFRYCHWELNVEKCHVHNIINWLRQIDELNVCWNNVRRGLQAYIEKSPRLKRRKLRVASAESGRMKAGIWNEYPFSNGLEDLGNEVSSLIEALAANVFWCILKAKERCFCTYILRLWVRQTVFYVTFGGKTEVWGQLTPCPDVERRLDNVMYSLSNHGHNHWWVKGGSGSPENLDETPNFLHNFLMNVVWLCNRLDQTG